MNDLNELHEALKEAQRVISEFDGGGMFNGAGMIVVGAIQELLYLMPLDIEEKDNE